MTSLENFCIKVLSPVGNANRQGNPNKEQAMETQATATEGGVTRTEVTPFHFTLSNARYRVDFAYKQHLGKWRISVEGATYRVVDGRKSAETEASDLLSKLSLIKWIEQPNYDLASDPVLVGEEGFRLIGEVTLEGDGKWAYRLRMENSLGEEISNVPCSRIATGDGKESYARLATAKCKAQFALLYEIQAQGVHQPQGASETAKANAETGDAETQPETVTVSLETAKALQGAAVFLAKTQGQPETAYTAYNEVTKAIEKAEREKERKGLAFGLIFGNAVYLKTDRKVSVYSQYTGSLLGSIWKFGDRSWVADHDLNVALNNGKPLNEHVTLTDMKAYLKRLVRNAS